MPKLNFDSQIANLKKPLVQAPISNVANEQSQVLDKAKGYDPLSLAYKASRVIQQGTAQSGAKVGLALYDIAKRVITGDKEPTALTVDPGAGKIEREAFKQFFGDERVSGITEDVVNAENFIKENAPKLEGSKNLATRYAGKALSGAEKLGLTAPLVAGLTALDFTGIGGGKKKIAEELLKETTEEGAEQILKQSLKLSDDVAKEFAPKFAQATEPKAIDLLLDEVDQVVKTGKKVIPKTEPLVEEARKYKSAEEFIKRDKSIYSDDQNLEALKQTDASFQNENTFLESLRARKDWNTRALRGEKDIDIKTKIKQSYGVAIAEYVEDSVKNQKSQLTDIWSKANAEVGFTKDTSHLTKVARQYDAKQNISIEDVTPKGFGSDLKVKSEYIPLEKLKGETADQAISRKVGYQIDNGAVKIEETRDGWQAIVLGLGDNDKQVFKAFKKSDVEKQVFQKLYPNIDISLRKIKPQKGKEEFGIDGLLKKELDDFTALPFEKQGEAFNDLSRQAQEIIMGMPPQEATTPLARVAEEIAQGKLKIKTPTDIKKDLLDELGGNYMRYFRNDKNLQSLDEIAGDIGVSEYELIDAVKSYQKPSEMANTWAKIDQLYSGQELPEETLLAEGQKRLEELRQQAQRLLLSPQPALRNTEQIQILDDIGSLADDTVKLKGLQEDRLLNLDNLNISKKAKDLIEDELEGLRSEIKDVTGDVLSNEQTIKFADNTAKYLNKAIGKEETLKWQGALLNLRQQVAKQAEDGIVSDDFIENLMVLKTVGTDIARRLQSFSIGADPSTKRPLELILSKILKMSDNADDILKQAKGVDFNDYKQATEFYRKFFKPKVGDWVDLVRYNSMLSSPLTHMINLFSNGVTSVLRPVLTKAVAGGLDFLGSMKTGKRTRFSGEALAYLKGYSSSYKEAFGRLTGVLKGERAFENIDLKQLPLTTKGVANKIENFLRVPLKALEASDQFFSALVEGGERSALNFRKGKGVKVFGIESKAKKEAGYTLFRQSTKVNGQGNVLEAIDHATNVINHARGHSNPLISIPAKFTIPFVSTPMNIIKQSIEYSPLGFATMIGSADKLEQASKALIGSALFATAGALIVSNRMTWAEPISEKDRDAYRENKMQPYSIKIGDKWVSYQKLPPILSMPLAITAMINDAWKNRKLSDNDVDLFLKSMAKYGQFMSDQSYLKNMGDLLEAFSGNEVALSKLIGNYPQQLVPLRALSGWVARLSDDLQRKVDYKAGFIDKQVQLLMQNIPGLSQSLPARLDSEGKPLKNEGRLINAFSPLKITTQSTLEEKRYRMIESAKKLERDTNEAKADLREQAEKLDAELLTMPKDQANKKVNGIKKTNPKLYEALKDTAKARKNKLNSVDRAIKALGVENGARAKFIFDMLNEYPTAEEKNKIIKQMKAKGLITDKVYQQMRKLKNSPL